LFSNKKTAAPVANILLGRKDTTCCEIFDKSHNTRINLKRYNEFLLKHLNAATINQQRTLPVVKDNWEMLKCIADGGDI